MSDVQVSDEDGLSVPQRDDSEQTESIRVASEFVFSLCIQGLALHGTRNNVRGAREGEEPHLHLTLCWWDFAVVPFRAEKEGREKTRVTEAVGELEGDLGRCGTEYLTWNDISKKKTNGQSTPTVCIPMVPSLEFP